MTVTVYNIGINLKVHQKVARKTVKRKFLLTKFSVHFLTLNSEEGEILKQESYMIKYRECWIAKSLVDLDHAEMKATATVTEKCFVLCLHLKTKLKL